MKSTRRNFSTYIAIFIAFNLASVTSKAQTVNQEVKILKTKLGLYLETKQLIKSDPYYSLTDAGRKELGISKPLLENSPDERAYWVSQKNIEVLRLGYQKAIAWSNLNLIHRKEFEKEICRIRLIDKETYRTHGYVQQLTKDARLVFNGLSDGSFYCTLRIVEDAYEIRYQKKIEVQNFLNLMNGKYVNKPIDDIFH